MDKNESTVASTPSQRLIVVYHAFQEAMRLHELQVTPPSIRDGFSQRR
jgi:hypothetical protein